jgi:hypothetical protein
MGSCLKLKTIRTIVSYICHNVNLPVLVLPWKNDYFVINDHFHFPRFLLIEKKIPIKPFRSTDGGGAYAAIKTSKPSVI